MQVTKKERLFGLQKQTNYLLISLVSVIITITGCSTEKKAQKNLRNIIQRNLTDANTQYRYLASIIPHPDYFPRSFENNKLTTVKSSDWVSGFYPGTLVYLYKATRDSVLKKEAERIMVSLAKEQYNTTNHDVGFMINCSFGNLYKIDPQPAYKQILINSAKSLSTRFNPKVGSLKSWDSKNPKDFLVIIDNMMNLELLFEATKLTGDSSYYKMAVSHANTAMKNHFRSDYSSFHLVNYDPETGEIKERKTVQGYADSSSWARGQAWGLYGFAIMYRETKDKKYLDQANHIAAYILNHTALPQDKIPYWDYNAPNIPKAPRDASAAAIMASAFIELSHYSKGETAKEYNSIAETILTNLSKPDYKAEIGKNGGFLLKHSVGNLPAKSQIDVPLSYADYYYVEAMLRYVQKD